MSSHADDLLDAIGELYGNGDIRFDSETPRREAVEAMHALVAENERLREALERIVSPRSGHLQRDQLRSIARGRGERVVSVWDWTEVGFAILLGLLVVATVWTKLG
jgi:hypothetical protein